MSRCKKGLSIWGLLGATPLLLLGGEFIGLGMKSPTIAQPAIAQSANPQIIAQTPNPSALSQGNALLDTGYEQYQQGQLREALESYRRALETFQQSGGDATEQLLKAEGSGIARQSMGLVYARLGQYQNALDILESTIKFQEDIQNRAGKLEGNPAVRVLLQSRGRIRSTYSLLGLVYNRLGQYAKALTLTQEALSRSGRGPVDYELDGEIFSRLGTIYTNQGQMVQALTAYYRAMVMVEEVGYPFGRDISKGGKPVNFIQANQKIYGNQVPSEREISAFLERSLAPQYHAPTGMHPWARFLYVTTLNNIGDTYRRLGRSQATQFYLKAVEASRFTRSAELQAISLNNLGQIYDQQGQFQQAQGNYQQALTLSRSLGDRALEGKTLSYLGTSYLQNQQLPQAVEALQASVAALESLRPGLSDANFVSLFDSQSQTYEQLQRALIAQKQPEQALEVAERSRARAFVELLARRSRPVDGVRATVQPLSINQIRQVAKAQNSTLVEYSVIGDELIYIWVVKPTGEVTFRQTNLQPLVAKREDGLADYVERVRRTGLRVSGRNLAELTNNEDDDRPTSAQLKQLYQLLIEPIADQLPQESGASVVFMPQQALFLVPFAALQNASGQYLIERYAIAISPSIQVLQLNQSQTRQASVSVSSQTKAMPVADRFKSALVVGNPTMPVVLIEAGQPPERLSDLPGSEAEATAIAGLLNVPPLTRNQATEQAVVQKMQNQPVIHLATHGLLDDFKGLGVPGAIALAPNSPNPPLNEGLLTANEILDLKLNADLVVLSACDTGRGRITGDGVIGLSRSLLLAGTSNVVVSLWAVPDEATAELMTQFYRELLTTPDKASALRQAMLKTLQNHPQPRDWAAFILIGSRE